MRFHFGLAPLGAFALLGSVVSTSHGAILASYNFNADNGTSADADTNSLAGDFAAGLGLTNAYPNIGSNHTFGASAASTSSSEANAITNNDYASFTVTASSGYKLDLDTLTFDITTSWGLSTAVAWGVSVRNDSNTYASQNFQYTQGTGVSGNARLPQSVSLTSMDPVDSITFRFYFWDGASGASSYVVLDNVVLNGVAAIPEPASLSVLAAGATLVMRRRRA